MTYAGTKNDLFNNADVFNQIYEKLFSIFILGIKKNHKMEYYSFSFNNREIRGRATLPEVNIDEASAEKRACELFRIEYQETKCYPDYLLKRHFPEIYEALLQEVLSEDVLAETESQVDKLINEIIDKNFN